MTLDVPYLREEVSIQANDYVQMKKKLLKYTFWPGWEILTHTVVDPCQRILNTKEMGLCSITHEGLIYVKNAKGFIFQNLSYKISLITTLKLNAKIKLTKQSKAYFSMQHLYLPPPS